MERQAGSDIKKETAALMEAAEAVFVSTIGEDGYPDIRAMFNLRRTSQFPGLAPLFAAHANDHLLYFTTNTSSRKVRQIRENPKTAVYFAQPADFRGLSLVGDMEIVEEMEVKRKIWQQGWELYYPGGVEDPDNAVLRLAPIRGIYYYRLMRSELTFGERP